MVTMEMMDIRSVPLELDSPTAQRLLRVMSLVVVSTLSITPASTPRMDTAWVWRNTVFNDNILSVVNLKLCVRSKMFEQFFT